MHLSDSGSVRYAMQVGNGADAFRPNRTVDGEIVASSDSQMTLAVRLAGQDVPTALLRQRVSITPADVSFIQLKALDRTKMTIIGVVGGLAIGALVAHYIGGVFGGNTEPRPGPGSELIAW